MKSAGKCCCKLFLLLMPKVTGLLYFKNFYTYRLKFQTTFEFSQLHFWLTKCLKKHLNNWFVSWFIQVTHNLKTKVKTNLDEKLFQFTFQLKTLSNNISHNSHVLFCWSKLLSGKYFWKYSLLWLLFCRVGFLSYAILHIARK